MLVHKVTLSTGKVVMLKDYQVGDEDLAIQAVGERAGNNNALMASLFNKEMIKLLVVEIDGKRLNGAEREQCIKLFSPLEYRQLTQVIGKLTGDTTDMGKYQIEQLTSGAQ